MANKSHIDAKTVGAAAGVAAAAAAAAAGAYWLYGAKDASKHRKLARSWMLKARAEMMDLVEKAQDIDKDTYMQLAGEVAKRYSAVAGVTAAESKRLVQDLKAGWAYLQAQKKPAARRATPAKKGVKKAAKKATKKASR